MSFNCFINNDIRFKLLDNLFLIMNWNRMGYIDNI